MIFFFSIKKVENIKALNASSFKEIESVGQLMSNHSKWSSLRLSELVVWVWPSMCVWPINYQIHKTNKHTSGANTSKLCFPGRRKSSTKGLTYSMMNGPDFTCQQHPNMPFFSF